MFLRSERTKTKRLLRQWNAGFERRFGRPATREERQDPTGSLGCQAYYREYLRLGDAIAGKERRLMGVLEGIGVTPQEFVKVRTELMGSGSLDLA